MTFLRATVIAFTFWLVAPIAFSQVLINEIVASNGDGLRDEDGDTPDWIELVNETDAAVNLAGWSLESGDDFEDVWAFPDRVIEAGGYLVVFASDKDRRGEELHTNFKLSADGEALSLVNLHGARHMVRGWPAVTYPEQHTDISWGFHSGDTGYLSPPTPGASNEAAERFAGVLPAPQLDATGGWLDGSRDVSLVNVPPGARAVYTTDGRFPDGASGQDVSGPISIEGTTLLRVAFVQEGYLSRGAVTCSFLALPEVLRQTRAEAYPEFWAEGIRGDYAMDASMLASDEDRNRLAESMRALPVVSVVTEPGALFDPATGIYTNTLMEGPDWERPASIEWFGDATTEAFQVDAGIQIQGRSSRQPRTSPKHSFRIVFKTQYGPKTLERRVYADDDEDAEHNTLVLRGTSNHSWTYPVAEQRERAQYLRDPWVKATQRAMGHVVPRSRFAHLFLNGMYWGVYAISERPDDAFAARHFGGPREEYDVIKGGETVEGNDRVWRRLFALADAGLEDPARYRQMVSLLDLDSFIDFMILNHYIGNETWDYGNWYASRRRVEGGRFRFFCWDAETSMNRVQENAVFTRNAGRPTALFHALRTVPDFRERFSERARMHLGDGGALSPERAIARYEALADSVETALFAESVRWGDYRLTVHSYRTGPFARYTVDGHWRAEKRRLLEGYFPSRADVLKRQYGDIDLFDGAFRTER